MSHSVLLELGNTCALPQSADIDPFEDIQVGASHGSPLPAHHQTAAARRLLPATTAAPATALTTHLPSPARISGDSRPGSVFRHKSCPSFSVFTDNSHNPSTQ